MFNNITYYHLNDNALLERIHPRINTLELEDKLRKMIEWQNNSFAKTNPLNCKKITWEQFRKWFMNLKDEDYIFLIRTSAKNKFGKYWDNAVGMILCYLRDLKKLEWEAGFHIGESGDMAIRSALPAMKLLIQYMFTHTKCKKIFCVSGLNSDLSKIYEMAGFKSDGENKEIVLYSIDRPNILVVG